MNYLIHFTIIRKTRFETVEGFNKNYDGAQDYDLFFRCIENGAKIRHIPKVLYHWRILESSSSQSPTVKPWIYDIGQNAVQDHLNRCNTQATVKGGAGIHQTKIQYSIDGSPRVDILIPTRRLSQFKKCLNELQKTRYKNYSLHAIINGTDKHKVITITSRDGDELIPFTDKRTGLIGPFLPYNWSKMNNIAIMQTNSPFIVTLNDDVFLKTDDWLEQFLIYAQKNYVGSVGCLLLNPDGSIQHAGSYITEEGLGNHCFRGQSPHSMELNGILQIPRECSGVTSACMMVRREIFKKIGYFDEKLRNYDDFEFSIRLLKNGYSNIFTPYVCGFHDESQTRPLIINPDLINYLKGKIMPVKELYYRYEWEMIMRG
jgi:GT2 family glycosyltransferase